MSRNDQELIAPLEKHKFNTDNLKTWMESNDCLLYTSPSPRDMRRSRMPSSA